jgi:hypothetical protein
LGFSSTTGGRYAAMRNNRAQTLCGAEVLGFCTTTNSCCERYMDVEKGISLPQPQMKKHQRLPAIS